MAGRIAFLRSDRKLQRALRNTAYRYLAICAGIGSLSGHLHGGANEAVVRMIDDIMKKVNDWENEDEIRSYLERILDKKAGDGSRAKHGLACDFDALRRGLFIAFERRLVNARSRCDRRFRALFWTSGRRPACLA